MHINTRLAITWFAFSAAALSSALRADPYHNVNGFFGERAAGLGGAYAAISDDPAGAFYNPAGLAFAYDNYISISASNYREIRKQYDDVFGPGQSYNRKSRNFLPNFFGAIKNFGKTRFAFSIVTPVTESFDQADQVLLPRSLPTVVSYRNDYEEDNVFILAGPSLAHAITDKLSLGMTLYFSYDSSEITTTQTVTNTADGYFQTTIRDRRRTMGLLPVLGIQYMPGRWAVGGSLRQQFVTGVQRNLSLVQASSAANKASLLKWVESTDQLSGTTQGTAIISGPPETGSMPRTAEARAGAAYFLSKYAVLSADVIHTTGYHAAQDNTQVDLRNGVVYLNDREIHSLSREPTTNYALGLEYYLTDNLSLRFGAFTNKANSRPIEWADSALGAAARNAGLDKVSGPVVGGVLVYNIAELAAPVRFEHADTRGYSFGFGWETARSALSITYSEERGLGLAQIDSSQAAQPLRYRSFAIYIVASTRN